MPDNKFPFICSKCGQRFTITAPTPGDGYPAMRIATLDLTPELFIQFCQVCKDGPPCQMVVKKNPLPSDAKVVGVITRPDRFPLILRLVIESESFADIPEGEPIPELPLVWFETIYAECTETVA